MRAKNNERLFIEFRIKNRLPIKWGYTVWIAAAVIRALAILHGMTCEITLVTNWAGNRIFRRRERGRISKSNVVFHHLNHSFHRLIGKRLILYDFRKLEFNICREIRLGQRFMNMIDGKKPEIRRNQVFPFLREKGTNRMPAQTNRKKLINDTRSRSRSPDPFNSLQLHSIGIIRSHIFPDICHG